MNDDSRAWIAIAAFIAITIITIWFIIAWNNIVVYRHAMENGYSLQTLPGVTGTYWVKDGEVMGEEN